MNSERDQIISLHCEVARLTGLILAQQSYLPEEWGLTFQQRAIMGTLINRDISSMGILCERIYGDNEPSSSAIAIRVQIHALRKKLARFKIKIIRKVNEGYSLWPYRKRIVLRRLMNPVPLDEMRYRSPEMRREYKKEWMRNHRAKIKASLAL